MSQQLRAKLCCGCETVGMQIVPPETWATINHENANQNTAFIAPAVHSLELGEGESKISHEGLQSSWAWPLGWEMFPRDLSCCKHASEIPLSLQQNKPRLSLSFRITGQGWTVCKDEIQASFYHWLLPKAEFSLPGSLWKLGVQKFGMCWVCAPAPVHWNWDSAFSTWEVSPRGILELIFTLLV